jgi:hypothetical protein
MCAAGRLYCQIKQHRERAKNQEDDATDQKRLRLGLLLFAGESRW